MSYIQSFLSSSIQLHISWILILAVLYIVIHQYRHKPLNRIIDIYLNYIPVLTHEFGHILFNKISGGKARDLVIVAKPSERDQTSQQGYAITQSSSRLSQIITTLGGYIMPPLMLFLGYLAVTANYPSIFIAAYLFIFCYFVILTSRKLLPIIILLMLIVLLYGIFQSNDQELIFYFVSISYHFILGMLLGEVLQSSWTIFKLTFFNRDVEWDGTTLDELTRCPTFFFSTLWIAINLYTVYKLFTVVISF